MLFTYYYASAGGGGSKRFNISERGQETQVMEDLRIYSTFIPLNLYGQHLILHVDMHMLLIYT